MAGRLHSRNAEFQLGMAPNLNDVLGVFTQNNAVLGLSVMDQRKINDGIFSGPKGAYGRYDVSGNATNVAQAPIGSV
ncbi:hypothetical protein UFOVP115_110 [uncultured Caudovirales phage]|uniref:Uncharacterized protein n=1 Tax=uncultured Caudovirales phage TaxID=2100421 RepID=A0A6J5L934_9CAUD|nr:hypothetical protein UFOVP115_110 [uncultured Caudovirales phage]